MVRTTENLVKEIIVVLDTVDLTPFIEMANGLVTELATGAKGPSPPYDASRLELIERWLAAHFYTNRDPRAEEDKTGQAERMFRGETGLYLESSLYGQTAMALDTNGELAKLNRKLKKPPAEAEGITPSITWFGTEEEVGFR